MSDIAKIAGVSKAAVSFALNGKPGVSEKPEKRFLRLLKIKVMSRYANIKRRGSQIGQYQSNYYSRSSWNDESELCQPALFDTLISNLTQNIGGFGGQVQIVQLDINHLQDNLNENTALLQSKASIVLATDLNKKQVKLINQKLRNVIFIDTYFKDVNADFISIDNFQEHI
ncbi:LacI family DNA-binding transcriptional regulator [Lactobacillus sp. R2/2]|nr:LacI family DNA-binding transcriptional regulator [Lactobacillus sp. R2/2]